MSSASGWDDPATDPAPVVPDPDDELELRRLRERGALLGSLRRCYSMDELHRIYAAHAEQIRADAELNEVYHERSMSLDGP
jgi:hypothetical protein